MAVDDKLRDAARCGLTHVSVAFYNGQWNAIVAGSALTAHYADTNIIAALEGAFELGSKGAPRAKKITAAVMGPPGVNGPAPTGAMGPPGETIEDFLLK